MAYQDIVKILESSKVCSSIQNFIDIYLRLPGIPTNGQLTESDCIRVRICEGRFALLIREVGYSLHNFLQLDHPMLIYEFDVIYVFYFFPESYCSL